MIGGELVRLDPHDGGDYDRPVGWVEHDDGTLCALDEYGVLWPVAAFDTVGTLAELDADVQAVLGAIGDPVDMTAVSVVDHEAEQ